MVAFRATRNKVTAKPRSYCRGGVAASPHRATKPSWGSWREFPCFHADLPGFGFAFFVCDTEFFSPAWANKKMGAFFSPNPQNRVFAQKRGFSAKKWVLRRRRVLRSPRGFFGSYFCMPPLSKKGESRHAGVGFELWLGSPVLFWRGVWVGRHETEFWRHQGPTSLKPVSSGTIKKRHFCRIRVRGGRGRSPQVSSAAPIGSALIRSTTL